MEVYKHTAVCVVVALVTVAISDAIIKAGCVAGGAAVIAHVGSNTGRKHCDCNAEETQPADGSLHRASHVRCETVLAWSSSVEWQRTNGNVMEMASQDRAVRASSTGIHPSWNKPRRPTFGHILKNKQLQHHYW